MHEITFRGEIWFVLFIDGRQSPVWVQDWVRGGLKELGAASIIVCIHTKSLGRVYLSDSKNEVVGYINIYMCVCVCATSS